MGHSSIQMTVDIYGHLIPGANVSSIDRWDASESDATFRNLRGEDLRSLGCKSLITLVGPEGFEPPTKGL